MNGYDTEVRRGYWQALRAVALDAMPPVIQPQLMLNLLSDCQFRNVQMALCMVSSSDRLHTLVLLRANGRSQGDAAQCAEEVVGLLQAQFEDAGFAVGEATNDLLEKLLPCRYESGTLFHASETEGGYYIPADLGKIPPIDWAGISSALCRAKQAVFAVHFMPTVLLEAEKRIIDENLRYLEAKGADATVYEQLKACTDETLFFAAISMFGDLRTKREIAMILNRCFLHEMVLSTKMLNEIENLCVLPYRLANELAENGHSWTGQLMPVMQRFSHLMKKEQAAMCFALPRRAPELSGVRINTMPRQNQLLPEPMCRKEGIWVGKTDGQNQRVHVPFEWLPLHMAIVGMPGMGKTTCALGILKQIYDAGYPFLIIEPTKTEYRALIDSIPDLRVYTAGRSDLSPLAINPFLPPQGCDAGTV